MARYTLVWNENISVYTRNHDVASLIEQRFGIELERIETEDSAAYEYSGSTLNGRHVKPNKIASMIGNYMKELEEQGYEL